KLVLELLGLPTEQAARPHIDLDVELAELRLEVGVRDDGEHLGVAHRRVEGPVHEVELDLQTGQWTIEVEPRLAEHPSEHVQALAQLLAVELAVLAAELPGLDVLAHRRPPARNLFLAAVHRAIHPISRHPEWEGTTSARSGSFDAATRSRA